MSKAVAPFAFAMWLVALAGCNTIQPAPVEDRGAAPANPTAPIRADSPVAAAPAVPSGPDTYVVKAGETVYRIAFEHGVDYHDLAAWNGIDTTFALHPGQVLRLRPPGAASKGQTAEAPSAAGVVTAPLRTAPPVGEVKPAPLAEALPERPNSEMFKSSPKGMKLPYSDKAYAQLSDTGAAPPAAEVPVAVAPKAAAGSESEDKIEWAWPTSGQVISNFNETANLKGIDIGGSAGQPVIASAAGKVVYADSGLRGYGKLVVIKHNKTYLSAYAHNSKILVKEGQQVAKGQKIAEMGNSDADKVELHFEIRQLGKPVDPLKYLPPA